MLQRKQRISGIRTEGNARARRHIALLTAALLALFLVSFVWGRYDVPLAEVLRILWNGAVGVPERMLATLGVPAELSLAQTWTDNMAIAVLNVRLPRILLACLVGCALATAGTAYQSVFQNPMASPDILGASNGACFGAALAILLDLPRGTVTLSAFVFSLLSIALVYAIGVRAKGGRIVNLILAGVMISSLFSAGTSYIKLVADPSNQLPAITYWLMGSLSGAKMSDVKFVLPYMAVSLAVLVLLRWRINILTIGEDEARSMGINTERLRLVVVLCATFLTASSIAVTGMIGWIGLVVPHLCRRAVGNNCWYLIPASMLSGASFLLLVDNLSRNLTAAEIPIGILTAVIGAPFFIYLMLRKDTLL